MEENQTKENQILEIFVKSFQDFTKDMKNETYNIENKKITEDEISITFYLFKHFHLFFKLFMKKQKLETIKIPNIKGEKPLEKEGNPYQYKEKYSDETYLLNKLYENLIKHDYEEIVCYSKHGILIKNPLFMEGIYDINVVCIMKED